MGDDESIYDKSVWLTAEQLSNEYGIDARRAQRLSLYDDKTLTPEQAKRFADEMIKTTDFDYGKPRPRDFWDHLAEPEYDPWDKYMPAIPLATPVQLELGL